VAFPGKLRYPDDDKQFSERLDLLWCSWYGIFFVTLKIKIASKID
jgi:hypothetical protein